MSLSLVPESSQFNLTTGPHSDLLPSEGVVIPKTSQVYCIVFDINTTMSGNASIMRDAFPAGQARMRTQLQLFQLVIRAVETVRQRHQELNPDKLSYHGNPIDMYWEDIPVDPSDSNFTTTADRLLGPVVSPYGNNSDSNRPSAGSVRSRASAELDGMLTASESEEEADCQFMRDLPPTVQLMQKRLWVACHESESSCNIGDVMMEIIDENARDERAFMQNKQRNKANVGSGGGGGKSVSFGGVSSMEYGAIIDEYTMYKHFRLIDHLCLAYDNMYRRTVFSRPAMLTKVRDVTLKGTDNLAHPVHQLDPKKVIKSFAGFGINLKQYDYNAYMDDKTLGFTFPYPDRVVRLREALQTIPGIMGMMLPHRQRFMEFYSIARVPSSAKRSRTDDEPRTRAVGGVSAAERARRQRAQQDAADALGSDLLDRFSALDPNMDYVDPLNQSSSSVASSAIDPEEASAPSGRSVVNYKSMNTLTELYRQFQEMDVCEFDERQLKKVGLSVEDVSALQSMVGSSSIAKRSALHRVVAMGEEMHKSFRAEFAVPGVSVAQRRQAYLYMQREALTNYKELCTSSQSDISRVGQMLNAWFEERRRSDKLVLGEPHPLLVENMSMFASMILHFTQSLEYGFFTHTAHTRVLQNYFGLMDAYRHELSMHLSIIELGGHETSKSNVQSTTQKLYVPNTACGTWFATRNARTGDVDQNDEICFSDEAPMSCLGVDPMADPDLQVETRTRLTENKLIKQVYLEDPNTRKRMSRLTYAQYMQTNALASNSHLYKFNKDTLSRFMVRMSLHIDRRNQSLSEFLAAAKNPTEENEAVKDYLVQTCQIRQFLVYHTFKMTACKVLTDVDLHVSEFVFTKVKDYLKNTYGVETTPRHHTMFLIFSRVLSICTAIEYVFHNPSSPACNTDFKWEHMLLLDPLLHDSEEIAYFALDCMKDMMTGHDVFTLVDVLRSWWHKICAEHQATTGNTKWEMMFLHCNTVVTTSNGSAPVPVVVQDGTRVPGLPGATNTEIAAIHGNTGQRQFGASAGHQASRASSSFVPRSSTRLHPTTQSMADQMLSNAHPASEEYAQHPEYMNAYARINYGKSGLYKSIEEESATTDTPLSMRQIVAAVNKLNGTKGQLPAMLPKAHVYKWDPVAQMPKQTTETKRMPLLLVTRGDIFIHLDVMRNGTDPFEQAIRHSWHSFHTGEERDMLRCIPWFREAPYLMLRRQVGPNMGTQRSFFDKARERGKVMGGLISVAHQKRPEPTAPTGPPVPAAYDNASAPTAGAETQRSGMTNIHDAYDTIACMRRAERLYLEIDEEDLEDSEVSFERAERAARELSEATGKPNNVSPNAVRDILGYLDASIFYKDDIAAMRAEDRAHNSHMPGNQTQTRSTVTDHIYLDSAAPDTAPSPLESNVAQTDTSSNDDESLDDALMHIMDPPPVPSARQRASDSTRMMQDEEEDFVL